MERYGILQVCLPGLEYHGILIRVMENESRFRKMGQFTFIWRLLCWKKLKSKIVLLLQDSYGQNTAEGHGKTHVKSDSFHFYKRHGFPRTIVS